MGDLHGLISFNCLSVCISCSQGKGGALSSRDTRQYDDVDYDSFVGLMGRRSTGNLDIDDIFVGLLGRRSSDSEWESVGIKQNLSKKEKKLTSRLQ
uniref:Uncharacterized protein n=1 Tax=Electrophorus electricus TaxID=8005 RepID=A0A4W4EBK6_ELEEL